MLDYRSFVPELELKGSNIIFLCPILKPFQSPLCKVLLSFNLKKPLSTDGHRFTQIKDRLVHLCKGCYPKMIMSGFTKVEMS